MLSIENTPPDPQCPCEISQLNSHESPSDDNHHHQEQLQLDLSRFSIRDYVFNTRSKDIKTNWPFSQKNLQLCLKHGVKNPLPPFQSLDCTRNSSTEKCSVKSITSEKESRNNSNGKLSCSSDRRSSVSYSKKKHHDKLSVDCRDFKTSGFQDEKEFTAIQSPCLEAVAKDFPGPSTEKPLSEVPSSNKTEGTTKETVNKKCRLIVKLSNIVEPRLQEDTPANTPVVSETMASKVCPVCKSFSSSSNTTLNAHIDQCLSGEPTISPIKCAENPKVIKHRIKTRKTKLMVDIYETAKHFTLEDLDRRNGTNWSLNPNFPAPDIEMSTEEKSKTPSPPDVEDVSEEAAVYIDSNGTKLRILSKFNDVQSNSNAKDDYRPKKFEKRDKEGKLPLSKKRNLIRKNKLMKLATRDQNRRFLEYDHCHEIEDGEQRNFSPSQSCEKDEFLEQPVKACDQTKLNNFGMTRQWVGSKRTGLMKKSNLEGENQLSDKGVTKGLPENSHQSPLADPFLKRSSSLSSAILSYQNLQSSPESSKRQENMSLLSHDECKDPSSRKRVGVSMPGSQSCHNEKKRCLVLSKSSVKLCRKDGPSEVDGTSDALNFSDSDARPPCNERLEILSPTKESKSSFMNSRLSQNHAHSSRGKKFSSLRNISVDLALSSRGKKLSSERKNEFSFDRTSVPHHSKKVLRRKCLDRKKTPLMNDMSGSDEEALASQSASIRQHHSVEDLHENSAELETIDKLSVDRTRVLKIRKKRGAFMICGKEENEALKSSQHSPESDGYWAANKTDSFSSDSAPPCMSSDDMESSRKDVENSDNVDCEPIPNMVDEGTSMIFGKSVDPTYPDVQGLSQQFLDKPVLGGEEMGKLITTHSVQIGAELGTNEEPGNYYVDVDPIPIPGPPGSFLPSPGHMGSEDLHGNSSLSTCKVQSSEDEHELVDMDSSDSPVSALSALSNSIAARSYSVSLEKTSLESDRARSSFSRDSIDPVVESSSSFEQVNGNQSKTDMRFAESSPLRFKNSQPCCCSRKEGVLTGGSSNYQESQLFRRRNVPSIALPTLEKRMGCFVKRKFESSNASSETEERVAKSPAGHIPIRLSTNSEVKLPTGDDYESATPISTPVLRLMGKNLMVVNKDKDACIETRPSPSLNDHAPPLHHTLSQVPVTFNVNSSNSSVNHSNFRAQVLPPRPSMPILSNKDYTRSFPTSTAWCNLTPEQLGSRVTTVGTPVTDDSKKIIVIDDTPEREDGLVVRPTMGDSRHLNPLYHHLPGGYSYSRGPPVVQSPPSKGMNVISPVKWNATHGGSTNVHSNCITVSSTSSTDQLRSMLYSSPHFL